MLEHEADIAVAARSVPGIVAVEHDLAGGRDLEPGDDRSSVVLPEPDGPSSATSSPERICERHAVERGEAVERLDDVLDRDAHGRAPVKRWRLAAASSAPKRHSSSVFSDQRDERQQRQQRGDREGRRRNCTRCRGSRRAAAWCWSARGYGPRPPRPRRTRPWRGRCRAARRRAEPHLMFGSVTRQKGLPAGGARATAPPPRRAVPCSCISGISSRATKGKVTKIVASTMPGTAKMIWMSCALSQGPSQPCAPNSST